jgi:hypothetical protein
MNRKAECKTNSAEDFADDQKGYGNKQSWPILRYYPRIYQERLRNTTENLSQKGWSLS